MGAALSVGSAAIVFAATMIAIWFFTHDRAFLGAYNLAIAAVGGLIFVSLRAQASALRRPK